MMAAFKLTLGTMLVVLLHAGVQSLPYTLESGLGYNHYIYVEEYGTTDESCWNGGPEQPCQNLVLAFAGAQHFDEGSLLIVIGPGVFNLSSTTNSTFHNRRGFTVQGSNITVILCTQRDAGLAFHNSSDIAIINISVLGCGIKQNSTNCYQKPQQSLQFRVAIYVLFCQDVYISNLTVTHSNGIGLALINLAGQTTIQNSVFEYNTVVEGIDIGGGGVIVKYFSICSDLNSIPTVYSSTTVLSFNNCTFIGNNASTGVLNHVYSLKYDNFKIGKGGGMAVFIEGNFSNITIELNKCNFSGNIAEIGAGLYINVHHSHNSSVYVHSNIFESNTCTKQIIPPSRISSGGGVAVNFVLNGTTAHHNHIVINSTAFRNNEAYQGGGVIILSTATESRTAYSNKVELNNCSFSENVAQVGAAIDMHLLHSLSVHNSSYSNVEVVRARVLLSSCIFNDNGGQYSYSSNGTTIHKKTFATVYIVDMSSCFNGHISFINNTGSALVVQAGSVVFTEGAAASFIGNSGYAGGAISLLSNSWILVYHNTQFIFINNHATEKGGAIYALQTEQYPTVLSYQCFIRYYDPFKHPSLWESKFYFSRNYAMNNESSKNSIHATSVLPCTWPKNDTFNISSDISEALCWNGTFTYNNSLCSDEITTSPVIIDNNNSNSTVFLFPGMPQFWGLSAFDEKNNNVTKQTVFAISNLQSHDPFMDLSLIYTSDNSITISGEQNTSSNIMIKTSNSIAVEKYLNITMLPCPLGLYYNSSTRSCRCTTLFYTRCNEDSQGKFHSSVQIGTCIDYRKINKSWHVQVTRCPFTLNHRQEYILLPKNANEFCKMYNREGILCSKCIKNHGVSVYSSTFDCKPCRRKWLQYLAVELLPTTVFFVLVFVLHIGVTSGAVNGFIFFSQIVAIPYNLLLIQIGLKLDPNLSLQSTQILPQVLKLLYGAWNLDFSWLAYKSDICLGTTLSAMDIIALRYISAFYPLILSAVTYIIIELHARNYRFLVVLWRPCCYAFSRLRRTWHAKTSIIDAFATFILLSYTRLVQVSLMLLTHSTVHTTGNSDWGVFRYDPGVQYFHGRYTIHIIVSIAILCTLGAIPPLLLLLYPWKFFQVLLNRLKLNRTGLQAFIDAFQGCYKNGQEGSPDRRYFAGMYFVFRIVIFIIYTQMNNLFYFFSTLQYVYFAVILCFVLFQPYKVAKYNYIDACLITLLAIINTIILNCYAEELVGRGGYSKKTNVLAYVMLLIPFVCMVLYTIYYLFGHYEPFRRCTQSLWRLAHTVRKRRFQVLPSTDSSESDGGVSQVDNPERCMQLSTSRELQASIAQDHESSSLPYTSLLD